MKLYPSLVHAYTSQLRPAIVLSDPRDLGEASNCIPPTSHLWLRFALPASNGRAPERILAVERGPAGAAGKGEKTVAKEKGNLACTSDFR